MRIEPPLFELPSDAGLASIGEFDRLRVIVEEMIRNSCATGLWFEARKMEFLKRANQGARLQDLWEVARDGRVVLSLWMTSKEWRSFVPVSHRNLAFLKSRMGSFAGTKVYVLIDIFLQHFEGVEDVRSLAADIVTALDQMDNLLLLSATKRQKEHANIIFVPDGPRRVAAEIHSRGEDFAHGMQALGLSVDRPGQFEEACRRAYFVEVARGLAPGEEHAILSELGAAAISESPYSEHLNLGQAVCAELIDTCKNLSKGMPKNWLTRVTTIMCDPRLPSRSNQYRKWWQTMSRRHERLMKKWLAGLDLKLFLQILKDSSRDDGLRRMYPARKAFLEGLLARHQVDDACLVLSNEAAEFIRRNYGDRALAVHLRLNSPSQSVIYLNVDGLHLFEGTHNYAARLGVGLNPSHPCIARSKRTMATTELTSGLDTAFDEDGYFWVAHSPPLGWQKKLIDAFSALDVEIKAQDVLTPDDYSRYLSRVGA